jgi:phosphatidylglycerophosphate synthase
MVMGFKKFKEENKEFIKLQDFTGPVIKWPFKYVSIYLARRLKNTSVTPNQITTLSVLGGIISAYFFTKTDQFSLVLGGIILLLSWEMDFLDGSLARIKNMGTKFGDWYDHTTDLFGRILLFIAISFGVYSQTGNYIIWIFAFLAVSAYASRYIMYLTFRKYNEFAVDAIESIKKRFRFTVNFFYEGAFVIPMMALGAFTNSLFYVMVLFGIWGWVYCFAMFSHFSWKLRQLDKKDKKNIPLKAFL